MNKWALIGNDIDYSLSPLIHNYLINKYKLDANYTIVNSPVLNQQLIEQYQCGNITIPHKRRGFEMSGTSNFKDQSINSFKYVDGQYQYMSTDQYGLIDSIQKLHIKYIETRLHIIFGDGATSKMLSTCLQIKFNVPADKIYIISRKEFNSKVVPKVIDYNYFKRKIKSNYVLYNTSPLGNGKLAEKSPFDSAAVAGALSIFDATYNPTFNKLGKLAYQHRIKYINGLNMLIVQALYAFKFWTGINPMSDYGAVKRHIYCKNSSKMIVCAMPFAGKSTLYKRNKSASCDLDYEIEKETGIANAVYINKFGIDKFRMIEAVVLGKVITRNDIKIIFLGGGTLTNPQSINLLTDQFVVYMVVNLKTLKIRHDQSRANIQTVEELERLYFERDHHYRNISQFQVSSRSIEGMINEYLDN